MSREPDLETLEQRIRAAKPRPPALPRDFAREVMDELERQGLQVAPVRTPRVPAWTRAALGVLLVLAGVWGINGLAFEVRINGSLELLFFGGRFFWDFLAGLPFDLIAVVVATAGLGGWLLRAGRWGRVAMAWVLLLTYGVTGVGGLALAETGLNERLQTLTLEEGKEWPLVGWFYGHRARFRLHHPNFRIGRVVKLEGRMAQLENPAGEVFAARLPQGMQPRLGDHLRLAGSESPDVFSAETGQFCNRRRTERYFRHMGHGMGRGMGPMMGPGMGRGGKGGGMGPGGMMRHGMEPGKGGMGGGRGQGNLPEKNLKK